MRKIGEIENNGIKLVIKFDALAVVNPYWVYSRWYDGGWHEKLLNRYMDLVSCMLFITDYVKEHKGTPATEITNLVTVGNGAIIEEIHKPGKYEYYFNREFVFGATEGGRLSREELINLYKTGYFEGT